MTLLRMALSPNWLLKVTSEIKDIYNWITEDEGVFVMRDLDIASSRWVFSEEVILEDDWTYVCSGCTDGFFELDTEDDDIGS